MTSRHHTRAQRRNARWRVSAIAIVSAAGAAPLAVTDSDRGWAILLWPAIAGLAGVGVLLIERRPANPIGRLLLASGALMSAATAAVAYASLGARASPEPWVGATIAGVVVQWLFVAAVVNALVIVPLVFPDGRLISRRWRWPVVAAGCAVVGNAITVTLKPGPVDIARLDNPFGAPELRPVLDVIGVLTSLAALIAFGAAVVAVWIRFRRGSVIERQQLKWLVAAAGAGAIAFSASIVAGSGLLANTFTTLGILSFGALPIAIGIAVLRYRLYEIDRIISRTIAWAILTAMLASVFAAAVVALQAVLANVTQGRGLAVAVSTLVAFALFQPIRIRVQHAVDLRFYRTRYDAQQTIDQFAERIQSEVDLASIEGDLRGALEDAVRPASTAIWLRAGRRGLPSTGASRTSSRAGALSTRA